jgi:hypothetical protein
VLLVVTVAALALLGEMSGANETSLFEQTRDGLTVEYRVSTAKLEAMEEWQPQKADPILSPREAARIAAKHLRPGHPEKIAVIGVNLSGVGTNRGLRCYYVVTGYDLDKTRGGIPPPTHDVVLLVDGSIVTPTPAKRSIE